MVRVLTYRIQGCGATESRPKAGSPLIVIATALACRRARSCQGMAWQGRSMRLGWRDGQPLTASARDDMGEARVGTKKRLSDRTKKLMRDKGAPACRNSLTRKAPYKAQVAQTARPKVPMRRKGADCPVVVLKRGNARGAKGAGHRHWARVNRQREEPDVQWKAAAFARWHEPDKSRGLRPVL